MSSPSPATSNAGNAPRGGVAALNILRGRVGQELGVSPWQTLTQEEVDAFAALTGDRQYIHTDPARAAQTPFGGTIVHAYFTLALLPRLNAERGGLGLPDGAVRMSLNYGLNRVRVPAPLRVGARFRLRTVLAAVEAVAPDAAQVTLQQTIELEGGTKPALVAETLTRVVFSTD